MGHDWGGPHFHTFTGRLQVYYMANTPVPTPSVTDIARSDIAMTGTHPPGFAAHRADGCRRMPRPMKICGFEKSLAWTWCGSWSFEFGWPGRFSSQGIGHPCFCFSPNGWLLCKCLLASALTPCFRRPPWTGSRNLTLRRRRWRWERPSMSMWVSAEFH